MSQFMNISLIVLLGTLILVSVATLFFNFTQLFEKGVNAVVALCLVLVGGIFYFLLKISSIFDEHRELKEFIFYEVKAALEDNRFTCPEGSINKINALIKLVDGTGETFFILVNDDMKTLHSVSLAGLYVHVNKSSIRFLQESFVDEADLISYITANTHYKVGKWDLINDNLND